MLVLVGTLKTLDTRTCHSPKELPCRRRVDDGLPEIPRSFSYILRRSVISPGFNAAAPTQAQSSRLLALYLGIPQVLGHETSLTAPPPRRGADHDLPADDAASLLVY